MFLLSSFLEAEVKIFYQSTIHLFGISFSSVLAFKLSSTTLKNFTIIYQLHLHLFSLCF